MPERNNEDVRELKRKKAKKLKPFRKLLIDSYKSKSRTNQNNYVNECLKI